MTVRDFAYAHRFSIMIITAAFAVAVLWTTVILLHPLPQRSVTMATGPEGGAYFALGKQYREILAREGIELRLQQTSGALENLALLRNPNSGVSVAFLQGGITNPKDSPDIESLGTVFYEPLWFFYRSGFLDKGLEALRGRRISIGTEGSGTRVLALKLLARYGMDQGFAELLALPPQESGEKLLRGEIDAVLMIVSWDAPLVQQLLAAPGIELANFPHPDAYVALYPYLNKVVLPAGVINVAENRPSVDEVLFAPMASLVVRSDLHPAIQYLLLGAAEQIHSGPGIFKKAGQFPAAESIDLPLSDIAQQYYRSGEPFLQRTLPFWMAVLISRLLVLLIPVIGVLYPLFRFLPALYGWKMRRRVYKLYSELRSIEQGLKTAAEGQGKHDLLAQLDRLEEKANGLSVTVSYVGLLYMLKDHIAMVRGAMGSQNK